MELRAETSVFNDGKLNNDIASTQNMAVQAFTLSTNATQHFWFVDSGVDTGAHISFTSRQEWNDNPSGNNLLATGSGIALRNGLNEMATFSLSNGVELNGLVDGVLTNMASFTTNALRLGVNDGMQTYVNINSTGMDVYQGVNNVATFGSLVRIGKPNNSSKVIIQDNNLAMYTEDGNISFEVYVPTDASTAEQEVTKTYSGNYPLDDVVIEEYTSYVTSNTISISDVSNVPSDTYFTLKINLTSYSRWTDDSAVCEFYFLKDGSSQTDYESGTMGVVHTGGVDTDGFTYQISVQYNGSNTFVVSATYRLVDSDDGTMFEVYGEISMLVYTSTSVPIPSTYINGDFYANGTNVGSTYVMGACYLENSSVAQSEFYLDLDDAFDLDYAIGQLGWTDDVIVDIIMGSGYVINVGSTYTLTPTTYPSETSIFWQSSNPSVATVHNGVITGVSAGDAVITATVFGGSIPVSAYCDVTIT